MADPMDLIAPQGNAILATIRSSDGRPQLSNVSYAWDGSVARVSLTGGRAKTANLRRDPRAALEITSPDLWSYLVLDCDASLSPVAAAPDDATVDALVELYRSVNGEHDDWGDYRRAMVADQRLVLTLTPTHSYGINR